MANEQNLIPNSERTPSELREITRKGGIASGQARRERKALADILRAELAKSSSASGAMTKQEYIVAKCLEGLSKKTTVKDLRTIAEILGELKQNVNVSSDKPIVVVADQLEASELEAVLGGKH